MRDESAARAEWIFSLDTTFRVNKDAATSSEGYSFGAVGTAFLDDTGWRSAFTLFKRHSESTIENDCSAEHSINAEVQHDRATPSFRHPHTNSDGCVSAPYENLAAASRFRLASKGSALCAQIPTIAFPCDPKTPLQLEVALKKLQVDDEWLATVRWSVSHLCDEGDLACEDEALGRRPSQEIKLIRLLTVLINKTESGYGEELVDQGILSILFDLCTQFRESNRDVLISAMKVLANIAAQNEKCANAIASSEWLQRLAAMISMNSLEENLLAEKVCINALSALSNTGVHLETDVYQLYRSEEEPAIDIIFIHGLRGGVFRTWRAKDDPTNLPRTRCWPRSWLPSDVSIPMRILALDYASSLLHFRGAVQTLASRSRRFQNQLHAAGVGTRPIVFVGHSMGGLLVKRLLLDDVGLLHKTIGILFIATPHRGSPFAHYARFAVRPADDVVMLSLQNETNKKLHEDFLKICSSVPVICSMAETEEAPLILNQKGVLVPPESACFEIGPLYHIRDIHHNICKPAGPDDNAYGVILQFLHDVIFYLKKSQWQPEQKCLK
uniref:GPI inositol-deacylase n=1 Tax=Ascaris lumbricoides TaxID=6252 RepID=A0A9J2P2Q8_ASCLU